jgi:hypothetical protein
MCYPSGQTVLNHGYGEYWTPHDCGASFNDQFKVLREGLAVLLPNSKVEGAFQRFEC